ncbi:EAL domain-containing protein [Blautia sp. MSJ-19]|nr:EAL domain-containing protein [Blautia sp. MSJ-19]
MLIVLGIEVLLLLGTLYIGNVGTQLNRNAVDIMKKQVENRQNYLQSTLEENQNLSSLAGTINTAVENQTAKENISVADLVNDEEQSADLLENISDNMISTMRHRSVNGIFVILNTEDLDEREIDSLMPCVYIRDQDPTTAASDRNHDLLLERSPVRLVKSLGISTDKGWTPAIKYKGYGNKGILYPVFETAYKDTEKLNSPDYGHWTPASYTLEGDDRPVIAYSIPLILSDGTVYGVVGVEMMLSYLQDMIPYEELQNNSTGTYLLAETEGTLKDEKISVKVVNSSSKTNKWLGLSDEPIEMTRTEKNLYETEIWNENYVASAYQLNLYNKNAPFSDEQWILIGIVQDKNLYAFTNHIMWLLKLTILATLLVGLASSFIVSRRLAKPVSRLSDEVSAAQESRNAIPKLSETGIRELDQFSTAITSLSRDVLNTSTKFLRIMEMASVEIGGYELRFDTGSVYYTENFFSMLGIPLNANASFELEEFRKILKEFMNSHFYKSESENTNVYCIRLPKKGIRYVRMEIKREEWVQIGLVEDITVSMMERLRIEHERDYDALTGLYNRRAFKRESEDIFSRPEEIRHAAFIMMDLDNLKYTNDTFGHDWGDEYIRQAGLCLEEGTPKGTLSAHISGDEFNLLFYGYESQNEIREAINKLKKTIDRKIIRLPNGQEFHLSISGGIAWYPEDSNSLGAMRKHADFAMYQVKRSEKGRIAEFDQDIYDEQFRDSQIRKEFHRFVDEELVTYYFQPLISARTGEIEAYEALMRSDLPILKRPDVVMKIAREEGALREIERMTMFHATGRFMELKEKNKIKGDALLFLNSIASQHMEEKDEIEFARRFGSLQEQMVIEITEEESLDYHALEHKKRAPGFSGVFALDDYGSGYSNEKSLLDLAPKYIKVDLSIIRDIDTDPDKQQIVENIVAYAHKRGMKIVAEGLETPEEIRKVLELEVDILQGFYLARPEAVPGEINPKALQTIRDFYS